MLQRWAVNGCIISTVTQKVFTDGMHEFLKVAERQEDGFHGLSMQVLYERERLLFWKHPSHTLVAKGWGSLQTIFAGPNMVKEGWLYRKTTINRRQHAGLSPVRSICGYYYGGG
ncbi:hypothetical protein BS78_05G069600 [Paspalum vaginatum]|nr:hypothetical protein BS78_05G069600 [Paspalum vaginatum]